MRQRQPALRKGQPSKNDQTVVLDGKGLAVVENWTDAWVNSDTTIKGVTFKNGAVFSTKADNAAIRSKAAPSTPAIRAS